MKKVTVSIMTAAILCLLSLGTLADDHQLKEHFEFKKEVYVGSALVKPGFYLVKYNTETSEMKIMDGDKVVATAKASVKMNDKDWEQDAVLTKTTPEGEQLTGLRLGGQREELTIAGNAATSTGN